MFWRNTLIALIAVVAVCGFAAQTDVSAAQETELAQSQGLMQCMEQCIRSEGTSEKATCKSRCANIPGATGKPPKKHDCMGNYKTCKRGCAKKDKACKKACKGKLMQCS